MRNHLAIFLTLSLSLFSYHASAATVIPLSMAELVHQSDTIFVGRIINSHSYWENDKILTRTLFSVEHHVLGNPEKTLTVTTLGGTAEHPILKAKGSMEVPGGLQFEEGEEALLFTHQSKTGLDQVVGLTQGKFEIILNPSKSIKYIPVSQKVITSQTQSDEAIEQMFSPDVMFGESTSTVQSRDMELEEMLEMISSYLNKTTD